MTGYSCNLSMLSGCSRPEALGILAGVGFTHVSLGAFAEHKKAYVVRRNLETLRDALQDSPLEVDWFHAPFITPELDSTDDRIWSFSLAGLLWFLERAGELGARAFVVHPYLDDLSQGQAKSDSIVRLREALEELVAAGQELGVQIALENMPYANHPDIVPRLLDDLPDLGFCFDAGHQNIMSNPGWLAHVRGRIACTHLHDNDGRNDQHLVPGMGGIDWPAVHRFLQEAEYDGVWGLEVHNLKLERGEVVDPEGQARKAFSALRAVAEGRKP